MRRTGLFGLLLLSSIRAWAAPSVAVVDLKFAPEVSPADRASLRAALDQALEHAGLSLVSETEIQYTERSAKELFACILKDRCRTEIGRRLNASLLLSGSVSHEDNAWEIALALFDVDVGALAAQNQRVCPRCTVQSFTRPIGELVAELVHADRLRPRGTLVVRTRPPGVQVQVDERPVGTSDLEVQVFSGLHTLALGEAFSTTVEVQPKQRKEVDFKVPTGAPTTITKTEPQPPKPKTESVEPPKVVTDGRRSPPKWRLGLAIGGGVVGLGLVGFGAKFLYDDGRGKCDLATPLRQCSELADTRGAGIGLVVTGSVLAIAGTALLIHDLIATRREKRVTIAPLIGRDTLGLVIGGAL